MERLTTSRDCCRLPGCRDREATVTTHPIDFAFYDNEADKWLRVAEC